MTQQELYRIREVLNKANAISAALTELDQFDPEQPYDVSLKFRNRPIWPDSTILKVLSAGVITLQQQLKDELEQLSLELEKPKQTDLLEALKQFVEKSKAYAAQVSKQSAESSDRMLAINLGGRHSGIIDTCGWLEQLIMQHDSPATPATGQVSNSDLAAQAAALGSAIAAGQS